MSLEDRLREALAGHRITEPGPDCPSPEALASFVSGNRRKEIVAHLAGCPSCREDVLVARPFVPVLRQYGWLAAAAAALFAVVIATSLMLGHRDPEPVVVTPVLRPSMAPKTEASKTPEPRTLVAPAPEVQKPEPKPEPKPVPKPEPEKPLDPAPGTPVLAKPAPEREAPKPAPQPEEKAPPAPTRAKVRGTLLALAGGCTTQAEGEAAWQNAKLAQSRDFSGSLRIRTETLPAKARLGTATYYLRGGSELEVSLEEGGTLVRLAKGEALFDVAPGKDLFRVETPTGRVTVKGTRFLVALGEVVVQRGRVEFAAGDRTVTVSGGERSVGAAPAEKTDVAKRLLWMKPLDETLTVKAEAMTCQQGMTLLPDRTVGLKVPPAANTEPSAEVRLKRKQAAPYSVWLHLHWGHNVAPGFLVQVHDAPRWSGKDVTFNAAWQWVKVGTFELPDEAFRIRVIDSQGGLRFDQILVTSDLDLNPEPR
jgi:hypothetical protein